MLNEAIIASLMEQTKLDSQNNRAGANQDLQIPEMDDEKILKEVMKMSSLEYQKQTGGIDLSHLKKNNNQKKEEVSKPEITNSHFEINNDLNDA